MNISLFFRSAENPELSEIIFSPAANDARVARRGKGLVFRDDQASFQWTKAVKSFALLSVGTKVALLSDTPFELSGLQGSPAASLDFAVSKPTEWVAGLFGGKDGSRDFRRIVFKISNSEQKLPGPVTVRLSSSFADTDALQVYLDDRKLSNSLELRKLFVDLGGEPLGRSEMPASGLEQILSITTVAVDKDPDALDPWYARADFEALVTAEISEAIGEAEVMESLGIKQAEDRLARVRPQAQRKLLEPVFRQLREEIPSEVRRYTSSHHFPQLQGRKSPLRIGCPPMAMSSLLLLRSLGADYRIPIEIFSHHQSSSAILAGVDDHQLDYAILSWGAAEKMLSDGSRKPGTGLMMLPRTSIDLVVPKSTGFESEDSLPVYVSTNQAGYPFHYFEMLRDSSVAPWSNAIAVDSNIVEVIARLTKTPSCAIVSFPFSGVLRLHFDYRVHKVNQLGAVRLGDNVLFRLSSDEQTPALDRELHAALRSAWYRLLEDPQHLRRCVKALLSDTQYILSLKRLGGLYRVSVP